jgi:hypothetical protein
MVTVSITRYALESDPLEVIAGTRRQAVGEREARRLGLGAEYQSQGDFVDLRVTGSADQKMRNFLDALKGFGVTRCAVTVDAAEEETELGESVDGFDVCFS